MIENFCTIPDEELWKFVGFASSATVQRFNDAYFIIGFHDENPYYQGLTFVIPEGMRESDWEKYFGYNFCVIVGLNPNAAYPITNLHRMERWASASPDGDYGSLPVRQTNAGTLEVLESVEFVPYGGPESPKIVMNCWQEVMISVLAHECMHVYQLRNNLTLSESDCEKHAFAKLMEYRTRLLGKNVA